MAPSQLLTRHRTLALVLLIGAVAAFAAFNQPAHPAAAATAPRAEAPLDPGERTPPSWAFAAPDDADEDAASPASAGATLTGKVSEQIDVAKYSYLRLSTPGGTDTWAAVPVTSLRVGQTVVVSNAEQMTQFNSTSLKRTFDVIYFGVLDAPQDLPAAASDLVLPDLAPTGDPHRAHMVPHPGPGSDADTVPIIKSARAPGPLGHTVAELNALDQAASDSKARVRATIVKVTTGVLGRTFLHLRDSTGAVPLANDLTATTTEDLTLGSEVLLEGTIQIDKDFGSGYRYRVLLADARRVEP